MKAEITLRCSADADNLDLLEPLWAALQAHHAAVLPTLGDRTPPAWLRSDRPGSSRARSRLRRPMHRAEHSPRTAN